MELPGRKVKLEVEYVIHEFDFLDAEVEVEDIVLAILNGKNVYDIFVRHISDEPIVIEDSDDRYF